MPEEEEIALEQVEEEPSEEPKEEKPAEEVSEEPVETKDAPVEDEPLEWDDWLSQFREDGLPEDIKTPEDLVNSRLNIAKDAEKGHSAAQKLSQVDEYLKRSGYPGGIEAFLTTPPTPTATTPSPQYGGPQQLPTYSSELEAAVGRGEMERETADYFKGYAKVQDTLLNQIYAVLGNLISGQSGVTDKLGVFEKARGDSAWQGFKDKGNFNRVEIDKFMRDHNYPDYDSAAIAMIASDPARFAGMVRDVEKKVEQKVRRKLRNITYQRAKKGGESIPGKPDWKNYQRPGGDINEEKLDADVKKGVIKNEEERLWVCDNIIKDIKERGL